MDNKDQRIIENKKMRLRNPIDYAMSVIVSRALPDVRRFKASSPENTVFHV